jgi:tetratricopeptide (TPR) repeat protein
MKSPIIRRGLRGFALVAGVLLCSCTDKNKQAAQLADSAQAKVSKQDYQGALADLDQAIQILPTDFGLFVQRGEVKGAQGNFDSAIADFSQALSLNPGAAQAYAERAMAEHNKGDLTASLADLNKALQYKPEAAGFEYRAGLRQSLGDDAGAVDDYNKAIEKPTDLDPHVRLLCLYREALLLRLGHDSGTLSPLLGAWPNDWLTTIGLYLNGKISETDFLASAEQDTPQNVAERECRADYFVGMLHLANHDNVGARKYFSLCGAVENVNAPEQEFAHGELKQLDKALMK